MDDDSDGHLTAEEFVQAMKLPSVEQYLAYLESLAMPAMLVGRRCVGWTGRPTGGIDWL